MEVYKRKRIFISVKVPYIFTQMISKYKNAQLVFVDGKKPVRIKRVLENDGRFLYEIRGTGEIIDEERLSLLKN
jgi:hypothetical protein